MSDTPAIGASGLPGKRVEDQRAGITITLRMTGAILSDDSDGAPASSRPVRRHPAGRLEGGGPAGWKPALRDMDLMKRLTIVLAFIFVFTAAFSHLVSVYAQKFHDRTAS